MLQWIPSKYCSNISLSLCKCCFCNYSNLNCQGGAGDWQISTSHPPTSGWAWCYCCHMEEMATILLSSFTTRGRILHIQCCRFKQRWSTASDKTNMKSTHLEDVHSADMTQMYFCLFWLKIQIYVINATFFSRSSRGWNYEIIWCWWKTTLKSLHF